MRYEDLPWPFDGWTVDELGVIHSPCGYRMTPQKIEGMAWLAGCAASLYGGRLMFADTPLVKPRKVHELSNYIPRGQQDIIWDRGESHPRNEPAEHRAFPQQTTSPRHRWKR